MKYHLNKITIFIIVLSIQFYHLSISPILIPSCRYIPTCSEYAIISIQKYGIFKGSWLMLKRICHCHPWGGDGYDPIP